jgi:hypothetical protein
MSYAKISDHGIEKYSSKRHRTYLQPLKAVEAQVAVLQQDLQGQRQQQQETFERNLVLTELNYTQERLQAIYIKHLQWLQCPDTAEQQQSLATSSCAPAGLWLGSGNAADPWAVQDARWAMFCLETASKEQVQEALSMTAADWTRVQRQQSQDLMSLMEIDKRSPEVQVGADRGRYSENKGGSNFSSKAHECSLVGHSRLTDTNQQLVVQSLLWLLGMFISRTHVASRATGSTATAGQLTAGRQAVHACAQHTVQTCAA